MEGETLWPVDADRTVGDVGLKSYMAVSERAEFVLSCPVAAGEGKLPEMREADMTNAIIDLHNIEQKG